MASNIAGNNGITNIKGAVTNSLDKTITQNAVTIASDASLTTKANLVTSTTAIDNSGILNLNGGNLASAISGTGTTNIKDNVTSTKSIEQNVFSVDGNKVFTNSTGSSLTVNNTLTNAGTITNNTDFTVNGNTANAGTIDGTGALTLNNDFVNNGTITQNTLTVATGKVLTNSASKTITVTNTLNNNNEIHNEGTLNVSGTNSLGLITDASTTKTGTLNLTGTISTDDEVTQNVVNVNSGSLAVANNITASTFNNFGATTVSTGSINATTITNQNGTISSSATNLVGDIQNKAVLNLSGGTTQGSITNYDSTNGTINVSDNLIVNHAISNNTLNLSGAKTITVNTGSLNLSGFNNDAAGTIALGQGTRDTVNLGAASFGANLTTAIDAFLGDKNADFFSASSVADGSTKIVIDTVTARSDTTNMYTKIAVANNVLKDRVGLSSAILNVTNVSGLTGTYKAKYVTDATGGYLIITKTISNLVASARNEYGFEEGTRTFTLSADEDIKADIEAIGDSSYDAGSIGPMSNTVAFTIDGTTANKFKINGNTKGGISVADGQTLTIQNVGDVYGFSGDAVTNAGTLNVTDTKFTNGIKNTNSLKFTGTNIINGAISDQATASGSTTVDSGTTTFNSTVTQYAFVNKGTTNIAAGNLVITTDVDNQGTLNLGAGDLASNIAGNNGITNIIGDVTSAKSITQDTLTTDSGITFTNSGDVTVNSTLTNAGNIDNSGAIIIGTTTGTPTGGNIGTFSGTGSLTLNGGTNVTYTNNSTSGISQGTLVNNANLNNNNTLSASIQNTGKITSDADKLQGTVANSGNLVLTGGSIQNNITKNGTTGGTIEINNTVTLGSGKAITDNNIELTNNSTLNLHGGSIADAANLIAKGGTIDLADSIIGSAAINLGNIDISNADLNVIIDTDLGSEPAASSDIITANSVTGSNNKVLISDINLMRKTTHGVPLDVLIAEEAIKSFVDLAAGLKINGKSVEGDTYMLTYDNTTGYLNFSYLSGLYNAVKSTSPSRVYEMGEDENVSIDLGDMGGPATGDNKGTLTINGNKHSINGNSYEGINVGEDQTLYVNEVGKLAEDGSIEKSYNGFDKAIDVAAGGNLTVEDSIFDGNTTDVNNNGTFTLKGNNIFNDAITSTNNTGATTVNDGTTTFNGNVTQDTITVNDGATANFNANTTSDIANSGTTNNAGILTGDVSNTGDNATFNNNNKVDGNITENSGTFNNNGKEVTGDVSSNSGTFNNKAGNVGGDVTSSGTFDNSNNGSVGGDVDNSGTFDNKGGSITGDVTSSGTFDNSNNGSVGGNVNSTGTFNNNSGNIAGDVTSSNAFNNQNGQIGGDVDNSGTFDNKGGSITGDVTSSGTFDNSNNGSVGGDVDITGGTFNNEGGSISGNVTNAGTLDTNLNNVSGTIENNGTMNISGGNVQNDITGTGVANINDNIVNTKNVTAGTVNVAPDKDIINTGNMTVNNALNNNGNIIGTGALNIGDNATADNTNGTILQDTINIGNNAAVTTNANDFNAINGINNAGTLTYTGGNVNNNITGPSTGAVNLGDDPTSSTNINMPINSTISGNQINLNNAIVTFGPSADISGASSLNVNAGGINVMDGNLSSVNLGNVNLNGNSNLAIDFNLNDLTSDKFIANVTNNGGIFNVDKLNIVGTTLKDNIKIHLGDTTGLGQSNVTSSTFDLPSILTPIRKINGRVEDGYLIYTPAGNDYKDFNPSVMAAPVAAQLGGYLTQLNSYDEAFRNMDMYMLMTASQRQALKNKNKIAALEGGVLYDASLARQERAEGWIRPMTTFERVPLKNGPKVSNVMYGSLIGAESEMYDLGHGWDGIWGAYIGYNGSHQAYDGVSVYQNGGTLGALGMAYKGNFFTGLTVNVGANGVDADTMFGNEEFAMLMTGVASKTGYNWELFNGKFIIQPSMLMSYSFVDTFNYRNGAGVKISSDPLHAIHLQPQLKFIGNLKNGWQPYASVAMIWNVMDDTKFKANDVSLPELSVKPYVKYGAGVRKTWGERFTGFFQTYITNGGRNGVGLQAGFTWAIGKDQQQPKEQQKEKKQGFFGKLFGSIFNHKPANTTQTKSDKKVIKSINHRK